MPEEQTSMFIITQKTMTSSITTTDIMIKTVAFSRLSNQEFNWFLCLTASDLNIMLWPRGRSTSSISSVDHEIWSMAINIAIQSKILTSIIDWFQNESFLSVRLRWTPNISNSVTSRNRDFWFGPLRCQVREVLLYHDNGCCPMMDYLHLPVISTR